MSPCFLIINKDVTIIRFYTREITMKYRNLDETFANKCRKLCCKILDTKLCTLFLLSLYCCTIHDDKQTPMK